MTFATAVLIAAGTYLGAVISWQILKEARQQWLLRRQTKLRYPPSSPSPGPPFRVNSNPHPNQPRPVDFPVAPPPTDP